MLADSTALAGTIRIAVASNFAPVVRLLGVRFEAETDHTVLISSASTGKLYAQIRNGAPFDVFLAADSERPALLETSGLGVARSRSTYAVGRLVLWSRDPALQSDDCRAALSTSGSGRIAIANPDTAPYGLAARSTLMALDLWDDLQGRIVTGENIAQTLQFVASGNAQLGFVALAQLGIDGVPAGSCQWPVPQSFHSPIRQQAVLLEGAADNPAAQQFLNFLRSSYARRVIAEQGYALPDDS